MQCPHCQTENLDGIDECIEWHQPLTEFAPVGSELERSITSHPIEVLAPVKPVTILPSTSVRDAMREMTSRKIGCVVVAENDALKGIFTERDILIKVTTDMSNLDAPVADFMTIDPATVTTRDTIAYTLQCMNLGGYRHMPVVNEDKQPIGVISIRDILRFLCIRFAALRTAE
ncbi:MAG: CBS domain-containing protein [Planctomycetota bacterium]|nr:CBS domain-containing protein [Planctomycetota bacterium]